MQTEACLIEANLILTLSVELVQEYIYFFKMNKSFRWSSFIHCTVSQKSA